MAQDYTNIDQPYNNYLERSEQSTNNGNVENQPVRSDGAMSDVWIKNFIRSEGWRPKTSGFYINGQTGYAEFSNVYVSGNIQALTGAIGGFLIGANYIEDVADSFGLSSEGALPTSVRLWAGATFANRASAPFAVLADGSITGTAITVSKIDIPNIVNPLSFHVDTFGNSWWGSNVAVGLAGAPAYMTSAGVFKATAGVITGTLVIGGGTTTANTVGASINAAGNLISNVINSALDTSASYIKSNFTFQPSGALVMATDPNNGLWISPTGILGKKAGTPTFTIDTLGNATFRGSLTGSTGTFGSVTINSGSISWSTVNGAGTPENNATKGATLGTNVYGGSTVTPNFIDGTGHMTVITASSITTGTLTADVIKAGTLNVGAPGQVTSINLNQSTGGGGGGTSAYLKWSGGSKIWSDTSNYMGYNAIGGYHYFYTANNEAFVVVNGSQAWFNYGISCRGNFNVTSSYTARFGGVVYFGNSTSTQSIFAASGTVMEYDTASYHRMYVGATLALQLSATGVWFQGTNRIDTKNYYMTLGAGTNWTLNGNAKTAIVPTSKGFNALYCTESPEVWFMDFCDKKGKLDPMFEEVTSAPYRYIKCEDGGYQVWGKRKGHENKRFESKTRAEFDANERFLNMNKPTSA